MDAERRRRIDELVEAAAARDAADRAAFLDEACGDDRALRQEVDSLVAGLSHAERILPSGAWQPPPLAPGAAIGAYEIEAPLGAGGMGVVYRARDTRLKRTVAIKLLARGLPAGEDERRRLTREARAASALNHPNIVAIYEIGAATGRDFIAMEYVAGAPLHDLQQPHGLPLDRALEIGAQVTRAMAAAHAAGLVHRDLKPANILVTPDGHAKIIDFGLARLTRPSTPQGSTAPPGTSTREGVAVGGTPGYAAPEQIVGGAVDPRADVFAIGAVLYEMLAGRRAFPGTSTPETLAAVMHGTPAPLGTLRRDVPRAVQRIVSRCLEKRAEARYPSAVELLADLLAVRTRLAARHARLSLVLRRPAVAALIVASALALGTAGVWLWREVGPDRASPADSAHRVAVLPFSYRGDAAHAYLGESMVDLLSLTLDGAGLLRTVSPRAVLGLLAQERPVAAGPPNGPGGRVDVDLATARKVARRLGVGLFVVGEIVEAGGRVRIIGHLYVTGETGEPVNAEVEGVPDDLFVLSDGLTTQLAVGRDASPAARLPRTAATTTENLAALKAFLQGEQLFRSEGGQRVEAYKAFTRATDEDPTFAIAWYRLSQLAYFSGVALGNVLPFAETAYRNRANLPWREKRLIEAQWAYARGAVRESDAAYREILQTDPDDVEALFGRAVLGQEDGWLLGVPPKENRQWLEAFLGYEPDDFMGIWLARTADFQDRDCASADSRPFPRTGPVERALSAFCGPPSEAQVEVVREAHSWPIRSVRWARDSLNWTTQNPKGAAAFGRLLVDMEEPGPFRALAHLRLAELELAQGRREAAEDQFKQLARVNEAWALEDGAYRMLAPLHTVTGDDLQDWRARLERWNARAVPTVVAAPQGYSILHVVRHDGLHEHLRIYLLGRVSARLGDYQQAEEYADALEEMDAPKDAGSLTRDLAQSIRAHVLFEQGLLEDALEALEAAPREVPFHRREASWAFIQPQERFLRAELLRRLGRDRESLRWYQSIHYWPESVLAGPSHLRQAEIHERLGHRERAAEQYRRFVELYQDCDEEFRPLVAAAEPALRRLGSR